MGVRVTRASPPAIRLTGWAALALAGLPGCAPQPPLVREPLAAPAPRPAAVEGAALELSLGGRREVAALIQQNGALRMWRSPGGLVVATDGPRVVATAGLPTWLTATRREGADPLDDPFAIGEGAARARRVVDLASADRGPEGMRFGLASNCALRRILLEGEHVIEERCGGAAGSYVNRFWLDPTTGAIWRSEQWVGGGSPLILAAARPTS
jgi:hypothetical protein